MKRKSVLALTLVALLSCSIFVGCSPTKENVDKSKTNIEQTGDNLKEDVKDAGEKIKDQTEEIGSDVKYTAINFKNDIVNAGNELKEAVDGDKKDYFTGTETDYMVGNDYVRVYEYDSADKLQSDIDTISDDGITINGKDVGYSNKPYYYRKGNTLIVYEGNDPAYVKQFNTTLGDVLRP